ncbi:MAG: cation transporter [Clostridia bacterium]|nr:cation transporter [Clostridia bacterium]
MKKSFKTKNVDCAHCAEKMKTAIEKIDGVNQASVNFLTQRLTIDACDEQFDQILVLAEQACKKIDNDFEIVK